MNYPTHSLGFLVGVTRERIARVSCLGWGPQEAGRGDNAYKNPFSVQASIMETDKGHITRCNVFWLVAGIEERAQWFGSKGTLYMQNMDVHPDTWKANEMNAAMKRVEIPDYWKTRCCRSRCVTPAAMVAAIRSLPPSSLTRWWRTGNRL